MRKGCYRRKLEKWLEDNNAGDVWRGLQNIAGHGKGVESTQTSGNEDWADEFNLFFNRSPTSHLALVNIQGLDIKVVESYKFLGVHLNNKLDCADNTHALYKKDQSSLPAEETFYISVVASAIIYVVVFWRG